jgi:predicted DNA-binding transcriptional regulator AlpA
MSNNKARATKSNKRADAHSSDEPMQTAGALTIKEFCARYQLDASTFHRFRENMPRSIRIGRGGVRIPLAEIARWEQLQVEREARRQRSA